MTRRFSRSGGALSEIVGALILTLIVVVSASSFAAFIAQQQKAVQAQRDYQLRVSQESLRVTSIAHTMDLVDLDKWATLDFTLVSLHQDESVVASIEINNSALKRWNARHMDGTTTPETPSSHMKVLPREQLIIKIDLANDFYTPTTISNFDPVKISVITQYSNNFSRTFIPPIAIGFVQTQVYWNPGPGAFSQYYILDGTSSISPTGGIIIKWAWVVTAVAPAAYSGAKAVAAMVSGTAYTVKLKVTDEYSMTGSYSFSYTA
jgi:hypothetical protein